MFIKYFFPFYLLILVITSCGLEKEHINIIPIEEVEEEPIRPDTMETNELIDTMDMETETVMEMADTIDCTGCIITTIAGTGAEAYGGDNGLAISAALNRPSDILFNKLGDLIFTDRTNHRLRKIDMSTGIITTIAGTGVSGLGAEGELATLTQLSSPSGLAFDEAENIYICDDGSSRIRRINIETGVISTFAGTGGFGFGGDGGLAVDAILSFPRSIRLDAGGHFYIADKNNHRVRRIDKVTNIITTVAGNGEMGMEGENGLATEAQLSSPVDVAFDSGGNMYIADQNNSRICRVDVQTGILTTIAGTGVFGYSGDGALANVTKLAEPVRIVFDMADNLYIADTRNNRIRLIDATTEIVKTIVGNGSQTFGGDGGLPTAASIYLPVGMAFDIAGNMYIADRIHHRIRKVTSCEAGIICQ